MKVWAAVWFPTLEKTAEKWPPVLSPEADLESNLTWNFHVLGKKRKEKNTFRYFFFLILSCTFSLWLLCNIWRGTFSEWSFNFGKVSWLARVAAVAEAKPEFQFGSWSPRGSTQLQKKYSFKNTAAGTRWSFWEAVGAADEEAINKNIHQDGFCCSQTWEADGVQTGLWGFIYSINYSVWFFGWFFFCFFSLSFISSGLFVLFHSAQFVGKRTEKRTKLCCWLQNLHSMGSGQTDLLPGNSFIPAKRIIVFISSIPV